MSQFCGSNIFLAFDPQNLGVTLMTLAVEEPCSGCGVCERNKSARVFYIYRP